MKLRKLVLGLLLLSLPARVQGQFGFMTNNGSLTITNYTGTSNVVFIPEMTNGLMITGIGNYAFMGTASLAAITIPDSVTNLGLESFASCENLSSVDFGHGVASIGDSAFRDCFSLTNVSLPDNVISVGDGAFSVCKNLTNATVGSGVTNLEGNPFGDCQSLTTITVDSNNPAFGSVDGVLFNQSRTFLLAYPAGKTGTYRIPNSVTLIAGGAFGTCFGLTGVTIPKSVTNVGGGTFANCYALANVTIPASITFMGGGAFLNCSNLAGVFFEGSAPASTGPMPVFSGLKSSATGYYLPGKTGWGTAYSGLPTIPWNPQVQTHDGSFGVQAHQFGFNITGTANLPVVVEACASPDGCAWVQLQSLILTNGSFYFTDPQWTNYPARFYRLRPFD